jgi:hypothetical protein
MKTLINKLILGGSTKSEAKQIIAMRRAEFNRAVRVLKKFKFSSKELTQSQPTRKLRRILNMSRMLN